VVEGAGHEVQLVSGPLNELLLDLWGGDTTRCRRWCSVVVARGGVEPPTYRFSGGRSYQLSYLALAGAGAPTGVERPRRDSNPRPSP
jgi:hypothetical protein